jgi:DNA repair protein RadC
MRIKDIPLENRPRERMKKLGLSSLSDAEILALILQKGTRSDNVIDMSNKLIAKYGLEKLSSLSLTELSAINGIGEAKATQVLAAFEISRRIPLFNGTKITCAKDVFEKYSYLSDLKQEKFMVLILDTKNKIIKEEVVSIGTLDSALIHPREIFKSAIKESANAIIVVHNHPSGDCTPSEEDIKITSKISAAGETLGIKMLDHVIVGFENYWSWQEI